MCIYEKIKGLLFKHIQTTILSTFTKNDNMMDQHQVNTNSKCSLAVEEYITEEAIFKRPKMLIVVWLKTLALIFVWIGMDRKLRYHNYINL